MGDYPRSTTKSLPSLSWAARYRWTPGPLRNFRDSVSAACNSG